ncbi:SRPBCC domain-containing protein [Frankia sp. CNm7]|uniref:SRPBCC domain-containing protein n=1 Tax=Frankia nepalensis TaxID=1836974 RepID=A0A937RAL3_9ACTN|nr:SRPBCC domain-containing protein [Frankia nepalensis]MBL7497099.1 SRPBCC domain-containing protein [Frankia nepalensis]MBL7510771.1 SRPBCC domain-containing protein [Frankia nepalensis]MBL7522489.1 SRPBCC domain-containing protein [Frankia nepalensis]MBL7626782.1 SRPBCC domain-containing protein [Frankia nepalensis]
MADILHRVGITAPREEVFRALTTREGLADWWTRDTRGDGAPGGVLEFRFVPGGFDMKVLEAQPAERVLWEVIDAPAEWVDTRISWDLRTEGDYTIIMFAHRGWREPVEFMHHCTTKWATYLMSLKSLLETGKGAPAPDDVMISDWH